MEVNAEPSVTVVTATRGCDHLRQAVESVARQSYINLRHLIVVDGSDVADRVGRVLNDPSWECRHDILCLPRQTGFGGFLGHRIYGAATFLVNSDYLCFLDDDNWFDVDHVASLYNALKEANALWAYALRRIVDQGGERLTEDNCESLGIWPAFNGKYHHVDTSCYFLPTSIALKYSGIWYRRFRDPNKLNPDMALCMALLRDKCPAVCNRKYSVNYRLGSSLNSVSLAFFNRGNAEHEKKFSNTYPWA